MNQIFKTLKLMIFLVLALDVSSVFSIANKENLNFVDPFSIVFVVVHIIIGMFLLSILSAAEKKSNGSSLSDILESDKLFQKQQMWYYIWAICLCLINFVKGLSYIVDGDLFNGVLAIIMGIALYILLNRTNRGMKDKVSKLLGEKSKALRDKLVENQKGALPESA